MTLEEQQFRKWLRRPTEFIANAWYLMAASGQTIIGYAVAFAAQLLAMLGVGLNETALGYLATSIYQIGVLALPVIWYASQHEGVDQAMRLNPPRMSSMLYAAMTAFVGVLAVNSIGTWWMLLIEKLGGTLYSSSIPIPTSIDELTVSILLVGVIPGVCEELFFRGALMGAWERRGTKQALLITSALFAMLHGSILGLPTQLMMGFVLGYIVLLSDSLYVGMIYHTVHNASALLLSYLNTDPAEAAADTYTDLAGSIAAAGGYVLLAMQTAMTLLLFVAAMAMLILNERRHGRKIVKIIDGDRSKMTWQELVVLIAGLVTVGIMYMNDILLICGVI